MRTGVHAAHIAQPARDTAHPGRAALSSWKRLGHTDPDWKCAALPQPRSSEQSWAATQHDHGNQAHSETSQHLSTLSTAGCPNWTFGQPRYSLSCFWILFLRGCSPDNTRAPWCLSGLEISNYIWPKSKPLATKVLLRTHKRPECILPTHDRDLSSNPPIHQSIFQDGTRKKGSNFMIPLNTKERKYW